MIKIVIGSENNYLPSVVALAKRVYNPDDVSSLDRYKQLFKACPEAFIFAIDTLTQQVCGYIIALPLDHDYYERTLLPDYTEKDLEAKHIRPFKVGANYITFFSIVADPKHPEHIKIFHELVKASTKRLQEYAGRRVYVTKASALTWSKVGIKMCEKMLRMTYVGENEMGQVWHNPKLNEVFVDKDTKEQIIKNFIRQKQAK